MQLSETNLLRLYDRSRVVTDWACPRKRFYQYEYDGRGIVDDGSALSLFQGLVIHDGLAAIAKGLDIDSIANAARKQIYDALLEEVDGLIEDGEGFDYANEQASLNEGLLRGFYKHVWPRLLEGRKVLFIEEEMVYEHDGLTFMAKPDLVVEEADGSFVYIEYKTTSSKNENWINSWQTAVQLHSTIEAIKATKGIEVSRVIVQGLYKGFVSYGKQSSPFCYAYIKKGQPPFSQDTISYEYKTGLRREPVWKMEGGVRKWVEGMPENVLNDQFPQVPPIFVDEDMVSNFFEQRAAREGEILMAMNIINGSKDNPEGVRNVMNIAFPQFFDSCNNFYGRDCEYKRLCFGKIEDPLSEGYMLREPHHQLEIDKFKEN